MAEHAEAMIGISIPFVDGRLGIMLDDANNRVAALDPEQPGAFNAGLRVGDLVVAIDEQVITALDGDSVMTRRAPPIDPTRSSVDFTVLRLPEDLMQRVLAGESLLPQAPPAPAAGPTYESYDVEREAALAAAAAAEAAHRNYPWAKEFVTADGQVKNMYNIKAGTVLQPLPQVEPSLAASRRKEQFANPRNRTSTNYLRVG